MNKFIFILVLFMASINCLGQDVVWRNEINEMDGFWKVKFSNNDSIVVAHGYNKTYFLNAKTGDLLNWFYGSDEVCFFDNDSKILRVNYQLQRFDVFNVSDLKLVDSITNAGIKINESPFLDISSDENYLLVQVNNGISIWDLKTKLMIKSKKYKEANLISVGCAQIKFIKENTQIFAKVSKTFEDPAHPGDSKYYRYENYGTIYDAKTLDSIDFLPYARTYRISKTCKYYAVNTGDPNFGVEIYDFATKQLIRKLQVNGPSLSGIEFSPDEKYLVSSNSVPKDIMYIWDIDSGENVHEYSGSSFETIKISRDGKFIITSISYIVKLYHFRTKINDIEKELMYISKIYPNPTSGIANIEFEQPFTEMTNTTITDINSKIISTQKSIIPQGKQVIPFNTDKLSKGIYFISIQNSNINLVFKLIKE